MSSHSKKYPSSSFIHHVPQLEKQSLKVYVFLFISGYILLLLPPSLWNYPPTPGTILRKRGVHQLLECWQWLRLGNPDSSSHVCVAVTWWVTLKFLCHQIHHQFIFYPQEMLQTPTSIWVLPKQLALSLYHLTVLLSSASNQPDYVGSHRFTCSPPVFVRASPLYLLYFFLSFRQLHTYHLHQKACSIDPKLASPPECYLCHLLYLRICDSVWKLPVCFSSLGHIVFQGGLGHLHLVIPVLVTEPLHEYMSIHQFTQLHEYMNEE